MPAYAYDASRVSVYNVLTSVSWPRLGGVYYLRAYVLSVSLLCKSKQRVHFANSLFIYEGSLKLELLNTKFSMQFI
jgi:hypothetical protein